MHKCPWALQSPEEEYYHDHEWGVPVHDDNLLFEFLLLEGLQAGLSWRTILNKREAYRQALDGFDADKIARYDDKKLQVLLNNPKLIRNGLKMQAIVQNARAFLNIRQQFSSFNDYIWQFTDGQTLHSNWQFQEQIPSRSVHSEQMSQSLKKQGFKFVGPVICYAFMQATGMVNDHLISCFRYQLLVNNKT